MALYKYAAYDRPAGPETCQRWHFPVPLFEWETICYVYGGAAEHVRHLGVSRGFVRE
jgi:hypothetical protein